MKKNILVYIIGLSSIVACNNREDSNNLEKDLSEKFEKFDVEKQLEYCKVQASKTLKMIPRDSIFPRAIPAGGEQWRYVGVSDWTSGFWPGILWYLYENSGEKKWKTEADKFTRYLTPLSKRSAKDHDLGFQIFNSFGNGYRLTGNEDYKEVILRSSDTLVTLYDPQVGTILSWPFRMESLGGHNTIIDNMMNLEMLLWSCKKVSEKRLCKIALNHADKTMDNQFRLDNSSYHVVVYDSIGHKIRGVTFQGFSDESMWSRGQAWAIYGYTMIYDETREKRFLDFVQKIADAYIERLPNDLIPYYDFDAPNIPKEPKDASAAAITASALLKLSTFLEGEKGDNYRDIAENTLMSLSTSEYQSRDKNSAFLLHSTGSKTSEIDVSINYADYYYLEALLRLNKLLDQEGVQY